MEKADEPSKRTDDIWYSMLQNITWHVTSAASDLDADSYSLHK
jgi:hypothetical protein